MIMILSKIFKIISPRIAKILRTFGKKKPQMSQMKLKELTSKLLNDTLKDIQSRQQNSSTGKYFKTAEYLLLEAKEYVDGAWVLIEHDKCDASIALSRWVLEASMNLLWAVVNEDEKDQRLKELCGEALRQEAMLQESLQELLPNQAKTYISNAQKAREVRKKLAVEKKLESLFDRTKSIENPKTRYLYSLYRICCAKSHPSLNVWQRFETVNNKTTPKNPVNNKHIACWMAASTTYYLILYVYCLTKLDSAPDLKDWWENEAGPLLG